MSIIEMVQEEIQRYGRRVQAVHLKVGRLTGIVADAAGGRSETGGPRVIHSAAWHTRMEVDAWDAWAPA